MSIHLRIFGGIAACFIGSAVAASAQEPVGVGEISAGYMFVRDTSGTVPGSSQDLSFPAGWYVSGGVTPARWLGFIGEVSGSHRNNMDFTHNGYGYSTDGQVYAFLGGPRFFHKGGRLVPFGQVLVGVARTRMTTTYSGAFASGPVATTETDFAIQPGGGLTVYLTEQVGIRVEGDYRSLIHFVSGDENGYKNHFRFVTGIVWEFGGR